MTDLSLEQQAILSKYKKLTTLDTDGHVWLVRDTQDSGIKVLKEIRSANSEIYKRLKLESIPGIPEIYDIIDINSSDFFVIEEYIHGDTAADYFRKSHQDNEREVINCVLSLCNTLEKIHSLKPAIVCRDIKPSNVMHQNGNWYITDFDIAREYDESLTQDTHLLGTFEYAPPEQYGFGQTDARSDIYSLAVTMNVLLTGKYPNEELARGELGHIIRKATQLDPNYRYKDVAAFSKAIRSGGTGFKSRIRRPSTIIAIVLYSLFGILILTDEYKSADGEILTGIKYALSCTAVFLFIFLPYFYNANYFGILDRTLRPFNGNRKVRLIMRIIFTALLSFVIPEVIVILTLL